MAENGAVCPSLNRLGDIVWKRPIEGPRVDMLEERDMAKKGTQKITP